MNKILLILFLLFTGIAVAPGQSDIPGPYTPGNERLDSIINKNHPNKIYVPEINSGVPVYSVDVTVVDKGKRSTWERFKDAYNSPFLLVRVLVYLTFLFFLTLIGLLIIIILHRVRDIRITAVRNGLTIRYQEIITGLLFEDIDTIDYAKLKGELTDTFKCEIFINELLDLHKNLAGESAEKLNKLYLDLGLTTYSIQKLYTNRWHIIAKGFRELSQMNVTDANDIVARYLNSPILFLRTEARLAWLRLNPSDPFSYLSDPKVQLTEWGKINALAMLVNNQMEIPSFEKWLGSSNPDVLIFAMQMTGLFKQQSSAPAVLTHLKNPDEHVREEALKVLRLLDLPEAVNTLKEMYEGETYNNQLAIIEILSLAPDKANMDFFEKVLRNGDQNQRIQAARGMLGLGQLGWLKIEDLSKSNKYDMINIITHVKDIYG